MAPSGRRHQQRRLDFHPSLGDLLETLDVELLVGDDLLQGRVLAPQLLELLDVFGLHSAVLVSPAVERVLGDLEGLGDLGDRLALAEHPFGLAELCDHLVGGVALCIHRR